MRTSRVEQSEAHEPQSSHQESQPHESQSSHSGRARALPAFNTFLGPMKSIAAGANDTEMTETNLGYRLDVRPSTEGKDGTDGTDVFIVTTSFSSS